MIFLNSFRKTHQSSLHSKHLSLWNWKLTTPPPKKKTVTLPIGRLIKCLPFPKGSSLEQRGGTQNFLLTSLIYPCLTQIKKLEFQALRNLTLCLLVNTCTYWHFCELRSFHRQHQAVQGKSWTVKLMATLLWHVTLCQLINTCRRFEEARCNQLRLYGTILENLAKRGH